MARMNRSPREALRRSNPALNQGIAAALLEDDLGWQIQDRTLVANSATAINIILNSTLTSQVIWAAVPIAGYSGNVQFSEVTAPTQSAVILSVTVQGISAAIGNTNVPARVYLAQRAE